MLKLMKYMKPFIISTLIILGLLFAQAQADLALPDYMSRIIDNGIQSGGIEESIPKAMRDTQFDHIKLFMTQEQQKEVEEHYELVTSDQATDKQKETYSYLKKGSVYILNTNDAFDKDKLSDMMMIPMAIVTQIASGQNEQMNQMLEQLPAGVDPFLVIAQLPEEQRMDIVEQAKKTIEAGGVTVTTGLSKTIVQTEYKELGMNMEKVQRNYIFSVGGWMLVIALLGSAASIIVSFLTSKVAAGLARNLRKKVFAKVESFSNAEFEKFSPSTLITRTTNDVQQVQTVLVMMMRIVIYAPILGVGALLKVMDTDMSMSWIIALAVAIMLGIVIVVFTVAMPKFKKIQKLVDQLNSVMREFLSGMLVIRAFNAQNYEEDKFENANQIYTKNNLFVTRLMAIIMPLMVFVMSGISILIIWVGGHQIDAGSLQIGTMLAFTQYAMQIIMAFLMISMIAIFIPRASVSAKRILEVLDTNPSIVDGNQKFDAHVKGVVEFKNVSFRYPGAEEDVLHDISFVAKPKQTTAFIGSTGSGKSTVINLVPRFFDATAGEVLVDGKNVRDVTQHDLREKIGYIPQKGILFSGTVATNLRYGKENASDDDLKEAAVVAQAMDFIEEKPEQFDTEIAQGGTNVSGGQKQRLSIARAVVKKPEIYILDDTFSALDFKTDANLRAALNKLCQETESTVLLVAQRISSIINADQIIVLDQGEIVGKGTHDELMKTCEVYQEIAYSQLSKEELSHE